MARKYEKVQELLPVIKTRLAEGKTERKMAEESGLKDKYVVLRLLKRERRRERKAAAGNSVAAQRPPEKRNSIARRHSGTCL